MLEMRRAATPDIDTVRLVLDEAAAWLRSRGIEQWPERWDDAELIPALEAGTTWLAYADESLVGTVTLQWEDETFWGAQPPVAGYIHRLAVRRGAAGRGAEILAWAERHVHATGRRSVRLDCWSGNARLRNDYETLGYDYIDDVSEDAWTVSRYEKRLPS